MVNIYRFPFLLPYQGIGRVLWALTELNFQEDEWYNPNLFRNSTKSKITPLNYPIPQFIRNSRWKLYTYNRKRSFHCGDNVLGTTLVALMNLAGKGPTTFSPEVFPEAEADAAAVVVEPLLDITLLFVLLRLLLYPVKSDFAASVCCCSLSFFLRLPPSFRLKLSRKLEWISVKKSHDLKKGQNVWLCWKNRET